MMQGIEEYIKKDIDFICDFHRISMNFDGKYVKYKFVHCGGDVTSYYILRMYDSYGQIYSLTIYNDLSVSSSNLTTYQDVLLQTILKRRYNIFNILK